MAIDVGSACIDRADTSSLGYTIVNKENPANATGTIDHLDVWMFGAGIIDVAAFYVVSGDNLSTRGIAEGLTLVIGDNNLNAPGDFTAFNINSGDYIGFRTESSGAGRLEKDVSVPGYWAKAGDYIPCTNETFTPATYGVYSLYATGTESGGPTPKNVSDSSLGADSLADLKVFLSISESGSGIEALLGLYEKLVPDIGLAVDGVSVIPEDIEKLVSDSGSGIEAILGLYQKLVSDIGSAIESISGPPLPPFFKELLIKRVNYKISPQGIKCDMELGDLYFPFGKEILKILRDLENEKQLLQANTKQLTA